MKQYTSKDRVEALMLTTILPSWQDNFNIFLEWVENYIDTYTGRNFVADSVASERVYDGNGKRSFLIDDCVDVTSITITDSTGAETILLPGTQAYLYPANITPKTRIEIDNDLTACFYRGQQNISVLAKWGYSVAVPKEIEFAATVILTGIINYAYEHNSEVESEGIGEYNVTYNRKEDWVKYERAMQILDKYKKISF